MKLSEVATETRGLGDHALGTIVYTLGTIVYTLGTSLYVNLTNRCTARPSSGE